MKTTNIGRVAGGFVNNASLTLLLVLVEVLIFSILMFKCILIIFVKLYAFVALKIVSCMYMHKIL